MTSSREQPEPRQTAHKPEGRGFESRPALRKPSSCQGGFCSCKRLNCGPPKFGPEGGSEALRYGGGRSLGSAALPYCPAASNRRGSVVDTPPAPGQEEPHDFPG
jgi:hypothetical protein